MSVFPQAMFDLTAKYRRLRWSSALLDLSLCTVAGLNPLFMMDSYKLDHRRQYPEGTEFVESNWTPRGSRTGFDHVVMFGLQYVCMKYLMDAFRVGFFLQDIDAVAATYTDRLNRFLGPNEIGEEHIRALHALGYLPIEIRALPEGVIVPLRVPMFLVVNTNKDFAWLTNYIETLLSSTVWQPMTTATTALRLRLVLDGFAAETSAIPDFVSWQGHDFSMRGMGGPEAAVASGMGHLVWFTGTDTIAATDFVDYYYAPTDENYLVGGSVPATEHSVMCVGGEDGEIDTFERIIDLYPSGIVSIVSDTWNLWEVCTDFLPKLRDKILSRPGRVVIRPDSGDPADILCGDPSAPEGSPERKGVIQLLWDVFGGAVNSKGYKQLDDHIGCIYGDGITLERARDILTRLRDAGFASTNIVFGMGSYSYQYVSRDTYGFAMKATWAQVNGEGRNLEKKPVTDDGTKHSARGRLAVLMDPESGKLYAVNEATDEQRAESLLRPLWRDGDFVEGAWEPFDVIRSRARSEIQRVWG